MNENVRNFQGTFQLISIIGQVFYFSRQTIEPVFVGPCHHGMAHPQVVDGETASDMEGSCE